jgi:hypothetical protein
MGGYNDGVYKLDEFCALLGETHNRLVADRSTMDNLEDSLEGFEDSVEKAVGGLSDAVAAFRKRLGEAEEAAVAEVEGLAEDAQQLEGSRLPAVQDQLEAAEDGLEDGLRAEDAEMDEAAAEMEAQGFAPLTAGLEALDAAGEAMAGDLEQDFSELDGGLDAGRRGLDEAEADTVAECTAASGALDAEDRAGLEADAGQCLTGWGSELAATLEGQTAEFGQEFTRVYDEFQSGAEGGGQELSAAVDALLRETGDYVRHDAAASLEGGLELTLEQALPALGQEVGGLIAALGSCEEAGAVLVPMVDELEVSGRVMTQVDRVLRAME